MDKASRKKAKKDNGSPKQHPVMCPLMTMQFIEPSPIEVDKGMTKNITFPCMGQSCAWWVEGVGLCSVKAIAVTNVGVAMMGGVKEAEETEEQ